VNVLRIHGKGDVRLHDEAVPEPSHDEELVRVTAVGLCGSDLHWYTESGIGDAGLVHPLVLGHEAGGVIAEGPHSGRRVAIDPAIPCGTCEHCLAGHQHFCLKLRFAGDGVTDGFLREYVAWPSESLVPVPDSIDDSDAAMLEPLGVAIHANRLVEIRPGDTVGVFGCGPIGLLLVQLARANGASKIVATDLYQHRLDAAREMGATNTHLVAGGEERKALLAAVGGRLLDATFEAAGEDDALDTAIALAYPASTVVVVGIPSVNRTSFTPSTARRKGLTIKLSRRMNRVYPAAIRAVEAGLVDVRSVVTATYPIDRFDTAFSTAARREGLKVVIRPSHGAD
jgi:L-iditol 2-dehydrogenase